MKDEPDIIIGSHRKNNVKITNDQKKNLSPKIERNMKVKLPNRQQTVEHNKDLRTVNERVATSKPPTTRTSI